MRFLDDLFGRSERQVSALASDLAQRSAATVWQRVGHRVSTMTSAEARGYIRARAAEVIHAEVERLLQFEPGLRGWAHEALVAQATEGVIEQTLNEMQRSRTHSKQRAA